MVLVAAATALVASATAVGADRPFELVETTAPVGSEGHMVAYGRSKLLVTEPVYAADGCSLSRVNLDGSLDSSFGDAGKVGIAAEDVAVTVGGKILVATTSHPRGGYGKNTKARITRLLPDGRPDSRFGVEGHVDIHFGRRYDYAEAVAVTPTGDILVAGIMVIYASDYGNENRLAVARLKPDGSLDRSFGKRGFELLRYFGEIGATDIAPTPSGGVLVQAGNEIESVLMKLRPDGGVDRRFGDDGYREVRGRAGHHEGVLPVPGFAQLSGGKILIAGEGFGGRGGREPSLVLRLQADGRIDRSFGRDGWVSLGGSSVAGLTTLPGGDVAAATSTVAGRAAKRPSFGAVVLARDGTRDKRFSQAEPCRASIAGRPSAAGVAVVGSHLIVAAEGFSGAWLLRCALPSRLVSASTSRSGG